MTDQADLWRRSVWHQAWSDLVGAPVSQLLFGIAVGPIAGAVGAFAFAPTSEVVDAGPPIVIERVVTGVDRLIGVLIGIGAGIVLFLLLLVAWAILLAPVRQRNAAKRANSDLEATVARLEDSSIALAVQPLDPERITNWDDDWRVSARVVNEGNQGVFTAMLEAIEGVDKDPYGDIYLHWDSGNKAHVRLGLEQPERLHIVRISDGRRARFLSPGEFASAPREFQQTAVKIVGNPVRAWLVLRDLEGGGCTKHLVEIALDKHNKPTLTVGTAEEC